MILPEQLDKVLERFYNYGCERNLSPTTLKSSEKRYKVLEMDLKGNMYFHWNFLFCKDDIIKRLVNGTYNLVRPMSQWGLSKDLPAMNCKDLKLKVPSATSGVYWIDPDAGSLGNAFQAYCDQQTDGGGWTLVWSYTFTAYSSFTSGANAVTPRPTWKASGANTRVSTTVPSSETHFDAMNFALWRVIGNETLIKNNINNWIVCKEGSGSIVMEKGGSVNCKLVKQVSQQCAGVVPNLFRLHSHGPYLASSGAYYYFDSNTRGDWPTHDPCGRNQANQLKGVAHPHGNIFVR
ncbi:uncharacterized protein [Montipora foliosa]|uniref:uncharacterized protein isoform X1 n=1 Tax=Montipora foliosa TaxID=591990 RepID=UPI0035F11906